MLIVGITGTAGAGKGTIVAYLTRERGFRHYSVRGYLESRIRERGLPNNRDTMVALANDLRAQHGPSYLVMELYAEARREGGDAVIESIRSPGEVTGLRGMGRFVLLGVDAPVEVRYARIVRRSSSTDLVSLEKFKADDAREMTSTDPNHQNIARCMKLADYMICNDGTVEALERQVGEIIDAIRTE